ncbi:MAG: RNA methyltransferase [Prevotellaceae bacterium]|jgi:TrmH family RNA methyltransferase|nr:RNA methyltransferase [Prevotellaceae bacterium]
MYKSQIKFITSLSVKKCRNEYGLFVAEGEKLVEELTNSSFNLKHLYITDKSRLKYSGAELVSEFEMKKISGLKTPSTSLAVVEIPKHTLNIKLLQNELVLALDDVHDPGNLGTIIRIADWFSIRHIICSFHTADCYNPKTIQATMGAITRVNVYYADLLSTLSAARELNMPVYGTFLAGNNIYQENLSDSGVIIMGSEGQGISPALEELSNYKLHIPPFDEKNTSESLNVAVAASIVCSEFRRKNHN